MEDTFDIAMINSTNYIDYVKFAYRYHDAAHDFNHVSAVRDNMYKLVEMEKIQLNETERFILGWVALMHDARDYKLVKQGVCRSQEEIDAVATKLFGHELAMLIKHIHNNCSWSKRSISRPIPENAYIRDIVRLLLCDADWLCAIGVEGIERCRTCHKLWFPHYTEAQIEQDVYDYIWEKLIYVYDGFYFDATRRLADKMNLREPIDEFIRLFMEGKPTAHIRA